MLKFSVSMIAVMSVMMSLSNPTWAIGSEDEGDVEIVNLKKRAHQEKKNKKKESHKKRKITKEDNLDIPESSALFSASLEGLPPEVRVVIYNHLSSDNYGEEIQNLLSLASTHSLFHGEIFSELPRITERFKSLIPNAEIEKWSEDPLLAYCQARAIDATLRFIDSPRESTRIAAMEALLKNDRMKNAPQWMIELYSGLSARVLAYFEALKEGSVISNSRILIHKLATETQDALNSVYYPKTFEELAITSAEEAFYSFWTDYKADKIRRKFNPNNYKAMMKLSFFVKKYDWKNDDHRFLPFKRELKILEGASLQELEKLPPAQLLCLSNEMDLLWNGNRLPHGKKIMLLAAANQNDPRGQFELAYHYLTEDNKILLNQDMRAELHMMGEEEEEKSNLIPIQSGEFKKHSVELQRAGAYWFRQAAEQDLLEAINNYAICHLTGAGVPQNLEKAFNGFQKAAEKGFAFGQFNLAICYENGWGTLQNLSLARQWYEKAANQGMMRAKTTLGLFYDFGTGGVESNPTQAAYWYERAINERDPYPYGDLNDLVDVQFDDAAAENNLGVLYELGRGVPQDLVKASKLYEDATGQENPEPVKNLIRCILKGLGRTQDREKAKDIVRSTDYILGELQDHQIESFLDELANTDPLTMKSNPNWTLISN